jgi:ice-binding like protein/exosortase sorting signal-containing protein
MKPTKHHLNPNVPEHAAATAILPPLRRPGRRLLLSVAVAASFMVPASSGAQTLGAAQSFAILGGSAVNANGTGSIINGDVGVSPGSSITGFPAQANVVPPYSFLHAADGPANNARAATLTLYNFLAAAGGATPIPPGLAGQNLGPGTYSTGAALLASGGTLTLSGAGTYIFQVASSLTTGVGSNVVLNGVDPCSVYWQVTSLATLDGTTFPGHVVAQSGVHLGTGASLTGHALAAAAGDVTLAGGNAVGGCSAAGAPPSASLGNPIPTLSQWATYTLVALLGLFSFAMLRGTRKPAGKGRAKGL